MPSEVIEMMGMENYDISRLFEDGEWLFEEEEGEDELY